MIFRMTPTIQCGSDDQSMQISPPPSVFRNNFFAQQNLRETPASDRTAFTRPGVRTNHLHCNPNQKDRHTVYKNSKRNTSYMSAELKSDVKRLLVNSSDDEETVSEEHLDFMRKRRALLLVTIQTMTLFHENQILERKLSALHKMVKIQIQKENKKNNKSTSE
ncbi:Hypothetical protein CINCED_3A015852 [Cinara cedri]|uniref:Uncharacterized protein n=1 Tax=Cinara cedri TaxID=506608 RepID=A0A5E4NFY5_9HEMI|nr:Hypothetical protein CINCED_3A015852 [Cinara cedri]